MADNLSLKQLKEVKTPYKADTRIYVGNISLRMEMIELQQGNKIWSCSISFKDHKTDENGKELKKKISKRCLDTLPKTYDED